MDRNQFDELMLTNQKIFSDYAQLFMALNSTATRLPGLLDWCWERYRESNRPDPDFAGFEIGFHPRPKRLFRESDCLARH